MTCSGKLNHIAVAAHKDSLVENTVHCQKKKVVYRIKIATLLPTF